MRLLAHSGGGGFCLKKFDTDIPQYAILSHAWGADGEEVTLKDIMESTGECGKAGYKKLRFCGEQAERDGLQYFWVDTCCIDKSDSTELGEALNSMFRWYKNAAKCYVYLADVSTDDRVDDAIRQPAFQTSRWFTRGWTLQELLAPSSVEFFCSNGKRLGDKESLGAQIQNITGIAISALQGTELSTFSIAERMSWRKDRQTKHEEDMTYCLLGIFDICMPIMYGEGAKHAFERLIDEICGRSNKRQREDLSNLTQANVTPSKRIKTSQKQPSSSGPSRVDPESLHATEHDARNIDADTTKSLLDQLYFTKIDERLTNLSPAQGTTCRWFLTKPEYLSWHDTSQEAVHGGFLWIKGNPGTGKSTLMKLLFEEAKRNAKNHPSQITLSFFFLARGTIEEKSTEGLYRSLLHQLFEKAADLKDTLELMTINGKRGIQREGWHEPALKQTLQHAIRNLKHRSLMIFVDALDECDQQHAADMVYFFEGLCDLARESQVQLQICFSSRHYPTIMIQKGLEITLEDETGHKEDVEYYIKSKLRLGKPKQTEPLRREILEKSSSIFLWVVLVVDILNSQYSKCSVSIKRMRDRLKEIPPELNALFEMILGRDGKNLEQLQACLKWVLFAIRPLKPEELYFAIQLSLNNEHSTYWDQEDVDLDQMKIFVRSSSKGLAEVTRNKASEVQFIHESVRDFLLGKYENQWSGLSGNFVGNGHELLKNCCVVQLKASIIQNVDIPDPLPRASGPKAALLRETIRHRFPFLEYAILNVLAHANVAQHHAIEQDEFLIEFPLQRWIILNNVLEKNDIRRYTKSASMLYILAERNLADLIENHPQAGSCFDVGDKPERYGPPFFAALATGSDEAVRALLEILAKAHSPISPLNDLCKRYCQDRKIWANFGRSFQFAKTRTVSYYVIQYSDAMLFSLLMELGQTRLDERDECGRTPLSWAARRGQESILKLLLETGNVDIDSKDSGNRTPLSWATGNGYEGVVQLLIETGNVDIDSKDSGNRTPLSWAARTGHESVVKLLLETDNVDIDSKDSGNRTPLSWAAARGHAGVVKLLLATNKVDVNSRDRYDRTPLIVAVMSRLVGIARRLLETGKAEVNLKDKYGSTALGLAMRDRKESIVKLLQEYGAKE